MKADSVEQEKETAVIKHLLRCSSATTFSPICNPMSKKSFSVNDPIHGQITLTDLEKQIVDHRYFQRLRRIKALGFLDRVFPSAKHSRFEHSIGACHVVGRLMASMKDVTGSLSDSSHYTWSSSSSFTPVPSSLIGEWFSDANVQLIRVAALLHDIGHGPFSHASEAIMPNRAMLIASNPDCSPFVLDALKSLPQGKADHEDYSLLMMDAILRSLSVPEKDIHKIASYKHKKVVPPKEIKSQVEIFGKLVDGEFDSDRMDYLLRDSYFCGVPYGKFDFDRLLEGLCLLQSGDGKFMLGIRRSSISAFEHFLFARFQMHAQIYTHSIDGACNKAFEAEAGQSNYKLPPVVEDYSKKDDENILLEPALASLSEGYSQRILWKKVFESFRSDEKIDSVIIRRLSSVAGSGNFGVHKADKPIKNESLLQLPVIEENLAGELITQNLKSVSRLISDYNTIHAVRRLFVSPEVYDKVIKARNEMTDENYDLDEAQRRKSTILREKLNPSKEVSKPSKDASSRKR